MLLVAFVLWSLLLYLTQAPDDPFLPTLVFYLGCVHASVGVTLWSLAAALEPVVRTELWPASAQKHTTNKGESQAGEGYA